MHRNSLLFLTLACIIAVTSISCNPMNAKTTPAVDRPNIIFIMADDHATQALSCYGSRGGHTDRQTFPSEWSSEQSCPIRLQPDKFPQDPPEKRVPNSHDREMAFEKPSKRV